MRNTTERPNAWDPNHIKIFVCTFSQKEKKKERQNIQYSNTDYADWLLNIQSRYASGHPALWLDSIIVVGVIDFKWKASKFVIKIRTLHYFSIFIMCLSQLGTGNWKLRACESRTG